MTGENRLKPKTWGGYWDHFGKRLVELANIPKDARVLDIGTGGGSSLYPAAERVGSKGEVIGIETCEGCFERTSSEIERCRIDNARMEFMDAKEMTFEDESFDFVFAGMIGWDSYFDFEKFEFKGPNKMMAEIVRVVKKGGRVGISGFSLEEDTEWMHELYTKYVTEVSPPSWEPTPELSKLFSKENEKGWRKILSSAGFSDIMTMKEVIQYEYEDKEAIWSDSRWKSYLIETKGMHEDDVAGFKEFVLNALEERGSITFDKGSIFAYGTK